MTSHQFALLLALAEHAGRVMSRDALMDLLKAHPLEAFDRSIDVHISQNPSRHRGRRQEAAARHHGARSRLRVRQGAGLTRRCDGSTTSSI